MATIGKPEDSAQDTPAPEQPPSGSSPVEEVRFVRGSSSLQ